MSRTRILKPMRRSLGDERGTTIVFVAVTLTALMSAVALAIDIGMLVTARSEAQRTADGAALAGAGTLIFNPTEEEPAREAAIAIGAANTIMGDPVEILPEDVEIDLDAARVEVTVRRIAGRGNAIPTWFARVFGSDLVDVSARAVAVVASGSGATCLKPWAVPDGFYDANGNRVFDDDGIEYYDADEYGYGTVSGSQFRNTTFPDNGIDPPGTTYDQDRGRPLALEPGDPHEAIVPSWYFPWAIPQPDGSPPQGANNYRWNIANCNTSLITLGQEYFVQTGAMGLWKGPTEQGIRNLIDQDPGAQWDLTTQSITNSAFDPPEASPRVGYMPLFDPSLPVDPGHRPIVFTNLTAFFIVGIENGNVIGRFLELSGVGIGGNVDTQPLIKFPRLVE